MVKKIECNANVFQCGSFEKVNCVLQMLPGVYMSLLMYWCLSRRWCKTISSHRLLFEPTFPPLARDASGLSVFECLLDACARARVYVHKSGVVVGVGEGGNVRAHLRMNDISRT